MRTLFWLGNLKGRDHSEDLGRAGKMLDGSYGYRVGRCGLDTSGSGWGPVVAGPYEHSNEPLMNLCVP